MWVRSVPVQAPIIRVSYKAYSAMLFGDYVIGNNTVHHRRADSLACDMMYCAVSVILFSFLIIL